MPGPVFESGDDVSLHTVEEADLDFVAAARNDPTVRRPLTLSQPSNGEQTREFFEEAISGDDGANLLVCVDERSESTEEASGGTASSVDERSESTEEASGGTASSVDERSEPTGEVNGEAESSPDDPEPVGMVSLFHEDEVSGTASIAYWVVPEHQRNGYASAGVGLLCDHAFGDRRLHKLRAEVLESNAASAGVLESLGFEREGVLRDEKFTGGEHVDVYRYGLLADEWGGR